MRFAASELCVDRCRCDSFAVAARRRALGDDFRGHNMCKNSRRSDPANWCWPYLVRVRAGCGKTRNCGGFNRKKVGWGDRCVWRRRYGWHQRGIKSSNASPPQIKNVKSGTLLGLKAYILKSYFLLGLKIGSHGKSHEVYILKGNFLKRFLSLCSQCFPFEKLFTRQIIPQRGTII